MKGNPEVRDVVDRFVETGELRSCAPVGGGAVPSPRPRARGTVVA